MKDIKVRKPELRSLKNVHSCIKAVRLWQCSAALCSHYPKLPTKRERKDWKVFFLPHLWMHTIDSCFPNVFFRNHHALRARDLRIRPFWVILSRFHAALDYLVSKDKTKSAGMIRSILEMINSTGPRRHILNIFKYHVSFGSWSRLTF